MIARQTRVVDQHVGLAELLLDLLDELPHRGGARDVRTESHGRRPQFAAARHGLAAVLGLGGDAGQLRPALREALGHGLADAA